MNLNKYLNKLKATLQPYEAIMPVFAYKNDQLYIDDVNLRDVAQRFGTPCYVYSKRALLQQWQEFENAFENTPHQICYAVKANSNLAILKLFADQQCGFDIVSIGELERVLAAQADPKKIVFSGVGKTAAEIMRAIEVGIGCFDLESEQECERIQSLAKKADKVVNVALRINPNIDAKTHPHIATGLYENKFGIDFTKALELCIKIQLMSNLKLTGIACHIGSQITELKPFINAMDCMLELINDLRSAEITIEHINLGGGLGVQYQNEKPPSIQNYVNTILNKLKHLSLNIIIEPGRSLTAHAGILLTQVEYLKISEQNNFAIVDAGMNDFMRVALYDAWHEILPVKKQTVITPKWYNIVGPVCESADYFGKKRELAIAPYDLLAITSVGAYGFSMSSNYNSRPRPPEVMIDGKNMTLIRRREQIEDLFELEL